MIKDKNTAVIPGIYNYCDSWCERCAFTQQCGAFGFRDEQLPEDDGSDEDEDVPGVAHTLTVTIDIIDADAEFIMTPEEEEAYEERQYQIRKILRGHILIKLARKYQEIGKPFINGLFKEASFNRLSDWKALREMGILPPREMKIAVDELVDCLEVIHWYFYQMEIKIRVALTCKMEEDESEDSDEQRHYDGIIKVVLLSIEKTMHAWKMIGEILPGTENGSLDALAALHQLKIKIIEEFPDAMEFKRPGFDEDDILDLFQ